MSKWYEYVQGLAGERPYNVERDELYQAYFKAAYYRRYNRHGKLKTIKINDISKKDKNEKACIDHDNGGH